MYVIDDAYKLHVSYWWCIQITCKLLMMHTNYM